MQGGDTSLNNLTSEQLIERVHNLKEHVQLK